MPNTATKQLTVADRWEIEDYDAVAEEFFRSVLLVDYAECLVTDESLLSDFASCGLPEELAVGTATLDDLYAEWDCWVIPEIDQQYGIALVTTRVTLVSLFERILAARHLRLH